MKLYAEISKMEPQEDGTLKVYGYASSETVDGEGEVITADAMKAALPDYMKFGAVREMHQPIAAGTAIEARVEDDGRTWFGAHVVDPVAVKKVQTQVYKGFSIGGKVQDRDKVNKNTITGLKLIEVSLVDRPCNPDAVFTMYKVEDVTAAAEEPTIDVHAPQAEVEATEKLADMLNKGEVQASKILDLIATTQAEPVAKTEVKLDLKKDLYGVRCLADCLQSIGYIASDAQYEAESEGDSSPVPAQLREWLANGVDIFTAMAKEETDEMISSLKQRAGVLDMDEVVAMGEKIGALKKAETLGAIFDAAHKLLPVTECDEIGSATKSMQDFKDQVLAKAGARHSKQDMDRLQAAHDHLADMGAKCMKADESEKIAKADSHDKDLITKLEQTISDLTKRLETVEKQPAAMPSAKLRVIAKGQDLGTTETQANTPAIEPILDSNGELNLQATVVKFIHSLGGKPSNG